MDYDEMSLHCGLDLDSGNFSVTFPWTFHCIDSRDWPVEPVSRRLRESSLEHSMLHCSNLLRFHVNCERPMSPKISCSPLNVSGSCAYFGQLTSSFSRDHHDLRCRLFPYCLSCACAFWMTDGTSSEAGSIEYLSSLDFSHEANAPITSTGRREQRD